MSEYSSNTRCSVLAQYSGKTHHSARKPRLLQRSVAGLLDCGDSDVRIVRLLSGMDEV